MFRSTCDPPGDHGGLGGCAHLMAAASFQAIGKVQTAIGQVTVTSDSGVVAHVKVGGPICQHDTIETGADFSVGITFTNGTAFNLSNNARMVLNEFIFDPKATSNSALFSLAQWPFAFIAGKVAKTGSLRIDTPVARIRGAAEGCGIGILTLSALAFSTIREIQAASRPDAFLDDDTITYKHLPHGTYEIVTRDGRVIVADDPGETIQVTPDGNVTRTPKTSSQVEQGAALAQQTASLSLGQGAAPGGSSTPTFDIPLQLQPINFSPAANNNDAASQPVTIFTAVSSGFVEVAQLKPPPPVLTTDAGPHPIIEFLNTTGSPTLNVGPSATLSFTDLKLSTVSASLASITWSGGTTLPSGLTTVLASALTTSASTDGTGFSGAIAATFSAADNNFDFLAANETLTVIYNVTATDANGVSVTQPVSITITGTNDAPVLAAAASGPHTVTEGLTTTGTLTFTDVDLNDHHTVSTSVASATWSGGAMLPSGLAEVLAGALSTTTTDSTDSGSGSIAFTFGAPGALDFLAAGQTLTITYNVTVTDSNGVSSTQPVTITSRAVNEAPVIASGAAAVAVSEEGLPNGVPDTLPDILDTTNSPTASGTITASDADGDPLTMTLGAPSTPLTSGGVAIAWTLQNGGHTLVGKAGATTIIEATITDAGAYTVTLTGPIDHPIANQEDIKTFTVPVTVSDGHATTPTTLSVTIEDDSPKAEPVQVSVDTTDSKTNVMLILDVSGSMVTSSGVSAFTRLDLAKAAVNQLLDQYDNRGDVMVRIVTFSDTGTAVGNVWMSVADAKAAIAALSAGGTTNYDAALLTAMAAFTDGTKLTGPGTQNVSYFLSDGDPTVGNAINPTEQAVWESFLTSNSIVSFALGIPNVGTPANLDPIAFDPASGTQLADTPIIVTDLGQLANTLVFTIPPVTGSVLTGAGGTTSNSFGADGGFVQSITVDGVIYTFNPAANGGAGGITTSGGGSFTYDGTTKTLTVNTDTGAAGGELAMVMTSGAFTFQPPTNLSSESVGFVLVDGDGDTQSRTLQLSANVLPAGVAGSPINLGLTDPADHVGPVTVTIAGVPSGWTLSEGADNGDGSWTMQASDVSTLSITSPDNYAGAMALQVTMSWTNSDGSSGFARITDNVEVFAQGAPIFAWSGDDHLTGSSGKDLFVFAQPIGLDTIYSFNAAEDQIDLIGYAGFAKFDDVQRHLAEDHAGNTLLTLADGQSITLFGVPVSSLGASNFVFDHTPMLSNTSTMTIEDGAVLPLSGITTNAGTIALDSAGNETRLELVQSGITLQGGGQVILSDSDENFVSGTIPSVTLTNVDNTISGAGQLGAGRMMLINNGTIIAGGTHALVIDTGPNVVANAGTLEAIGSGGLIVNSDIANSGLIWANGGNITINGAVTGFGSAMISGTATLEFGAASSADITFAADAAGTLILRDPADFTGTISGLSSNDYIDLTNISYPIASVYNVTYSSSTNITTLVITDGTSTDAITLAGNYTINTAWRFSDDGHGGTIVSDPQVSATSEDTSTSTTNELIVSSLPASATGQDTSVHLTSADNALVVSSPPVSATSAGSPMESTAADNDLIVGNLFSLSGNGDRGTFLFKANNHITDPEINFDHIDKNHLPQHFADNLLRLLAQLDDSGAAIVTDGAYPGHRHFDGNQLANFKFADDGSVHPGTIVHDPTTLALTPLSSDLSVNHGSAAPALANSVNVTVTVRSDAASDKFIFGSFVHDTVAHVKPDMIEIDHTVIADIQHLLHTADDTNVVSAFDLNHATAPQGMTKVQLPHDQGDFHFT